MEGQMLLQNRALPPLPPTSKPPARKGRRAEVKPSEDDDDDGDEYEEIFDDAIYNSVQAEEVLFGWMRIRGVSV